MHKKEIWKELENYLIYFVGISFENGKQEGYAIKYEGSRRLIAEWRDGELRKGSAKEMKDRVGCLKGRCDQVSGFGISVNLNGSIIIGNLAKAIHADNDIYIDYIDAKHLSIPERDFE